VNHGQRYLGRLPYQADVYFRSFRMFLAVPCQVSDLTAEYYALLDTAAEWCVLSSDVALELGYEDVVRSHRLHTRLGTFTGTLERLPVRFTSSPDEVLAVNSTWFISPEWPGPNVLGWKGCLERFAFGLNPGEEAFYFAEY
jgi:hypothetical protein